MRPGKEPPALGVGLARDIFAGVPYDERPASTSRWTSSAPSGDRLMDAPATKFRFCATCRHLYEGQPPVCPHDGTALDDGAVILAGKFVLGCRLGAGTMGVVHEAEQPAMERK